MIHTISDRASDIESILKEIQSLKDGIEYNRNRIANHKVDSLFWKLDPLYNYETVKGMIEMSEARVEALKDLATKKQHSLNEDIIDWLND